jgi:uncharacterized membrane protein
VLAVTPEFGAGRPLIEPVLERKVRVLVRLAALLALGASTTSLRWAVEMAAASGLGDEAIIGALLAPAGAAGSAQIVESAPRLALALGFDVDIEPARLDELRG